MNFETLRQTPKNVVRHLGDTLARLGGVEVGDQDNDSNEAMSTRELTSILWPKKEMSHDTDASHKSILSGSLNRTLAAQEVVARSSQQIPLIEEK